MIQRPMIGIGVLVEKDGRVLLMKRQNSHGAGTWAPPGGHLEFGEPIEECALRELEEETGVIITNPTFRAITNDVFLNEGKHYITVWMEGTYVSGEGVINSSREMTEVGWFSWQALPEPLFLPFENLVAKKCYP